MPAFHNALHDFGWIRFEHPLESLLRACLYMGAQVALRSALVSITCGFEMSGDIPKRQEQGHEVRKFAADQSLGLRAIYRSQP